MATIPETVLATNFPAVPRGCASGHDFSLRGPSTGHCCEGMFGICGVHFAMWQVSAISFHFGMRASGWRGDHNPCEIFFGIKGSPISPLTAACGDVRVEPKDQHDICGRICRDVNRRPLGTTLLWYNETTTCTWYCSMQLQYINVLCCPSIIILRSCLRISVPTSVSCTIWCNSCKYISYNCTTMYYMYSSVFGCAHDTDNNL